MKIALYIEDGLEQIVLTPGSDTEEAILEKIHDGSRQLSIKRGEFYGCQGGWTRQKKRHNGPYFSDEPNDKSTMIILTPAAPVTTDETVLRFDRLQDLVKTLIENDPNEPVADNGATVLDVWRDRAKRVLADVGSVQVTERE